MYILFIPVQECCKFHICPFSDTIPTKHSATSGGTLKFGNYTDVWYDSLKYCTYFVFQIYNEMIRDLLNPSSGILDMREDSKGGIQVAGLTELKARSTDEVGHVGLTLVA